MSFLPSSPPPRATLAASMFEAEVRAEAEGFCTPTPPGEAEGLGWRRSEDCSALTSKVLYSAD